MSGGRRACDYDAMLVSLSLRSIARVGCGSGACLSCGEFNSGTIYAAVRGVPATQPQVLLMPVFGSNDKSFFNVLEAKVAILGLQ